MKYNNFYLKLFKTENIKQGMARLMGAGSGVLTALPVDHLIWIRK